MYPFKNLQYCRPSLKLTFEEGIALLKADGADADPEKDLSTPNEKRLGRIVKEKYGTDFYMMDRYPMAARPFYTMPAPDNPVRGFTSSCHNCVTGVHSPAPFSVLRCALFSHRLSPTLTTFSCEARRS